MGLQLLKEAEGWSERHSELNEQIKLCQKAQRDLEETLAYKDNEIEVHWESFRIGSFSSLYRWKYFMSPINGKRIK